MSELRASDADREHAAERLRSATVEGRLGPDELEARVEAALSARTYGELERLTADLPAPRPAPERRSRRGRIRLDGDRMAFLGAAVLMVAIWALAGAGYFWPAWPILGWGLFAFGPGRAMGPCRSRRTTRRSFAFASAKRTTSFSPRGPTPRGSRRDSLRVPGA